MGPKRGLLSSLVMAVLAFGMCSGWAQAATTKQSTAPPIARGEKHPQMIRGTVNRVDPTSNPPTVILTRRHQAETIGVDVPAHTRVTEGHAHKALGDITPGDPIQMRFDSIADRLVAIRVMAMPHA